MKNKYINIILVLVFLNGCVGASSKGIFGTGVSVALDPRSLGTQIDDGIMDKNLDAKLLLITAAPMVAIQGLARFGLYWAIVRHPSFRALCAILQTVTLYVLLWATLVLLSGVIKGDSTFSNFRQLFNKCH